MPKYRSRFNRWGTLKQLYSHGVTLNPDVIHCHEPDSLLVGYLIKLRLGTPKLIYDCHEHHPEGFTENMPHLVKNVARYLVTKCESFLSKRADAVITVNRQLVDKFRSKNPKVIELPNYVLGKYVPDQPPIRKVRKDPFHLIYTGGLTTHRGLLTMVEVIAALATNHKFTTDLSLFGKFESLKLQHQFSAKIHELGVDHLIKYGGHIPHEMAMKEMRKAHVGLFIPYGMKRLEWGEPIKYFEYSASGLPVIMTNFMAKRLLLKDNQNGILVPPMEVQPVVDAIITLQSDPNTYHTMSVNGWKAVRERYIWENIEHRMLDLYGEIE